MYVGLLVWSFKEIHFQDAQNADYYD